MLERDIRLGKQSAELSPTERTQEFFNQNATTLALRLVPKTQQGMQILLDGTDKRIQLTQAMPYPTVGNRYKALEDPKRIRPGNWWAIRFPLRRMQQSLIAAGEPGSCVRIVRASRFEPKENSFVPMPREGDIANYFELEEDEKLVLQFVDNSNTLHLIRTGEILPSGREEEMISSEDADKALSQFLED